MNGSDHDLLIRVDTKVQTLIDEMKLMRDGTNSRLQNVENNKVDSKDFHEYKADVSQRILTMESDFKKTLLERDKINAENIKEITAQIDRLKIIVYSGVGLVAALQFVISVLK